MQALFGHRNPDFLPDISAHDITFPNTPISRRRWAEPYLLTAWPLTTAYSSKKAMLRGLGSWDGLRAMTRMRS